MWRSLYVICFSLVAFPIASVRAQDCDLDGIPDATEIANCPAGDLSCADCNNNGVPDGCDLNSQLGYTSATTLSTSSTRPVSLVVVDVNGANGPDLVVGTLDSPDLEIWLNNGSGTMTAGGLVAMGDGPFEIVAADFDGVGGMDLASVNMLDATGSVTVALNNGSGAFTLSTSLALGTGASGLVAAELDGSTGIDLAVVHEDDQLVTVLLNNGDGTFTVEVPPSPLATSDGPLRVAAYANNETGRMDLAVTNHDNNSLSLFRNNLPVGSFQTGTIRALPGAGPYGIVGTEIDSLNGGDLVITNELTNNVVVLLDSFVPGVFSSRGPFAVGSAPRSVVVADLNTDGSVDLATANFNSNTVSVLLGDGSGGFNPSSSSPATGSGPHYVVAADFDGDGLRDLATANRDGNSLSVFFATLASPTSVDCQLNDVPDECEMDCDNPPFAFCANTLRSTQGGCTVDVDPEEVDTSSFDPDGTQVILALDPPGPYPVGTTPVQLIVEDTCCQLDTCSAAVIITDGDAPSINCPSTQNVGTNFACTYIGQIGSATASDNCSLSQDILISNDSGGAFPQGMTVVTWTAVDEAGNSASCTQQILVFDDDDPFITCPSDRFLGTNLGCGYLGGVGSPTVSDNCSFPQDIDVSSDADAFMPVGLNMVTWTATDEAGNVDICTQRVTVVDDDPPSLVCPPALSVQTNVGCTYVGSLGTPTVQDNCSTEENITVTNNAPAALPLGIIQVTWTATDEAGNSETCIQQVSVSDGSPPAVTCPSDVTLQTNVGCTYVGSVGTATATDNCTPSSQINVFNTAPSAYPVGTTIVSWVAMDATGNTSVCLQNVTIEDDDAPVISCPQDLTVETNFGCTYVGSIGSATATDNCSSSNNVTITSDAPSALPIGPTTVTWTATDEAGNSASCTQLIMVVDNTNPEITCPSATQVAVNTGCSFGGSFGVATASDNCSIQANIAVTNDAPSLLPLGQTLVTWTATDEAGNSASCTQLVTVVDETPPEISCPAAVDIPINLSCSYLGEFGVPTATDNCSDTGAIEVVNDAPGVLPLGPTMVTWTATDEAGNSASCTQLVTVVDLTPPTITCPETLTVSTNSGCTRVGAIGVPTVSDGCSAPGDISITNDAPAALPLGRTLVTWTATDEAGNSASCVQTVVVEDTEAPSIACPQAVTLGTNAGCGYIGGTNDPVISDNCSAVENITIVNDAPAQFPLGPTLVTWTATDEAGNSASCTQLVTIVDDDAPSISCPSDSAVGTNVGCTYVGAIGLASATDNCSSVGNVTVTNDAPESFPLGETMVTWTATDEAGNSASCVQVVTVADDDAPVIVCPVPATFGTNTGCTYVGPLAPPTASDECSAASNITITSDAPAELLLGTTMVTWTATDESGNISSCTQLVTVVDDDAPGVVCPARNTFGTNSGCSYVGDIGAPIVSDNCSLSVAISVTNDAPSSFQTGTTQVTWTVTDEAGNSSSCVQEVVVVDDDAPELEPPSPVTFDVNMGCSYVGDFASPPIAVDNCSTLADIRFTHDAPVAFPPGATEVTWTATDAEGNVETVTQEVIVLDGIPPSLSCPGEVTLAADSAGCVFSGDIPPPLVSDNCSPPAAITIENDAPASLEAGSTSVTWRATDELGNVVTCQTLVTIEDRAPPALICPADIFASCTTQNGAVVDFTVEAVDECDQTPTITVEPASGSLFAPGVTVVFARATDSQGNSSTCTFSVSVNCEQGGFQIPGDCNQDGTFDISDPVCLLGFLFLGSPQGLPCGSGTRDDPSNQALYAWNAEEIDLSSAVQALQFLFFGTGEGHPLGEECLQMPDCPEVCDAGGA